MSTPPDASPKPVLPATGIHLNVPYADYAQWPAVRQSCLKAMRRSPLHCKHEMDNPRETDALRIGTAMHVAVFEPARFAEEFISIPKFDRRTKEGKKNHLAAMEAAEGKTVIDETELARITAMAEAIGNCRSAEAFVTAPGKCEVSALWKDAPTGLMCKARFDRLASVGDDDVIVELKTTRDASINWFGKDAHSLGYAMQAASYCRGLEVITDELPLHVIIAVENQPPHAVAVYMLNDESMHLGLREYRSHLETYAECLRTGKWPGYPDKIQVLDLPAWAARDIKDEGGEDAT